MSVVDECLKNSRFLRLRQYSKVQKKEQEPKRKEKYFYTALKKQPKSTFFSIEGFCLQIKVVIRGRFGAYIVVVVEKLSNFSVFSLVQSFFISYVFNFLKEEGRKTERQEKFLGEKLSA